ncbi:MAG: M23 family metallopeptidase [Candidatus Melainabacteria bacterium]|nr:M23 family metallopeptidase [Candidatus Melainabacteria bacterium]
MLSNSTIKATLNKSNLRVFVSLIILIFLFQFTFNLSKAAVNSQEQVISSNHHLLRPLHKENEVIEVISNETVNVGDTFSVKVKKIENVHGVPKIFFDADKIPVFVLSNNWYRSLIPLSADSKPGKHILEIYYKGHAKKIDLNVMATKYPLQELTLTKEVAALKASRTEKALVAKTLAVLSNTKLWSGKFIFPSTSPQSTTYGVKRRVNGIINPDYFHKGLDFAAPYGSSIKASEDGKVILVGLEPKGFVVNGNCIFLDHGHGVITGYLHLSKVLVKEDEIVKKGQIIGKVGSTGIASGPHLHWGLYVLGKTVDPISWTNMIIE